MKIGLILPLFSGDADRVLAYARSAEDLGYDGVFAFDHFFPPGAGPAKPSLDAFATLSAVAASTSRIRVGTLVARAALRPPGLLAKIAASIDDISDGRMILGIGTGDSMSEREQEIFGLPVYRGSRRRRHLVETVTALRALWAGEPYPGGELVPPLLGPVLPVPRTPGGPPVWVGGASENAVRCAASIADAWNGWGMGLLEFTERARLLASLSDSVEPTWSGLVLAGRHAAELEELRGRRRALGLLDEHLWTGDTHDLASFLSEIRDAGSTWAILLLAGPEDRAHLVAESVLPKVAGNR